MNDTDHLPPERRLPPRRRDQILRSVLHGEEPNMSLRTRVRWITPIAAAAAAALIAVGAVALTGGDERSGGQQPSVATPADDNTVPLDLGPLSEAELQEELDKSGWGSVDDFTFVYARRIDGPVNPIAVFVATRPSDLFKAGKLMGQVADAPAPSPADPIRDIKPQFDRDPGVGHSSSDVGDAIYHGTDDIWKITGIYRVADTVDRVEVRVGTPDGSEPWRVAEPHDGYVFWATWFDPAEYESGTELTVEWRAYDTDGNQLDSDLLPDQPRPVTVP
jgi:hypothetical protein